jgi:hypothetical protein
MRYREPTTALEIGVSIAIGFITGVVILFLGVLDILSLPLFLTVLAAGGFFSMALTSVIPQASFAAIRLMGTFHSESTHTRTESARENLEVAAREAEEAVNAIKIASAEIERAVEAVAEAEEAVEQERDELGCEPMPPPPPEAETEKDESD